MQKNIFIKNKKGLKLAAIIEKPTGNSICPFILFLHGFKGYKEEETYARLASVLSDNNIGSIRFDASGFGESEGNLENDYRFSNYVADVESVYKYLLNLPYVDKDQIGVFGHSMGGMQAIVFSANYPELKAVCIISAPNEMKAVAELGDKLEQWKKEGYLNLKSSKYGKFKIPYSFFEDTKKWRMTDFIKKVNCPLLFILGLADTTVPPEQTRQIFSLAKQPKKLLEIENMGHFYKKDYEMLNYINQITLKYFLKQLL
ncbi:MAG: alpha/beta fold hydrolase [Candidatus Andersenbacteria bacterium]|nr:alpha/beta fold hydrolase [Candidatus Andersenbacteria bacterium]